MLVLSLGWAAVVLSFAAPPPVRPGGRAAPPRAAIPPVGPVDTLSSGLASITRLPYGTNVAEARSDGQSTKAPEPALVLYEFEGCPFCRRVRETLTYLDLCCTIKPCAAGSRHREEVVAVIEVETIVSQAVEGME